MLPLIDRTKFYRIDGRDLREARQERRLPIGSLAKLTGIDLTTLVGIECANRLANELEATLLHHHLGVACQPVPVTLPGPPKEAPTEKMSVNNLI